ncbi:MAG TPA: ABC transporter ATP-binding protein [Bryobacteraceae bacterium]|nr:ABC transporter ATP-binding protein [Bryobacteraceae bacterium]
MEKAILQVDSLKKSYGTLVAVNGVSLSAGAGEIVGLLGPNGAGKTTTVSMIAGLLRPDSGSVQIEGRPLASDTDPIKRRIGLVPQDLALFDELTAQANLQLFAALYDLDGAAAQRAMDAALDLVGLADRAQERVKNYSGGMKRRLNLAAALLHDPQILLLDEPTVGVDPQSRNAIFDNLEVLKSRGKTLVYTTHYMEEAERLCDRVIIIDHGQVVANDTLQGLYRLLPVTNLLAVELDNGQDAIQLNELQALAGVRSAKLEAGTLRVGVQDLATETPRVLQWLVERGHLYRNVASERADLETVFLTLTGRSLRDA